MKIIQTPKLLNRLQALVRHYKVGAETLQWVGHLCEEIMNDLTEELLEYHQSSKFILSMVGKDSRLETIGDQLFSATELENVLFIQPLSVLSKSDFADLYQALDASMQPNAVKPIIVIPYDIKVLKAKLLISETEDTIDESEVK